MASAANVSAAEGCLTVPHGPATALRVERLESNNSKLVRGEVLCLSHRSHGWTEANFPFARVQRSDNPFPHGAFTKALPPGCRISPEAWRIFLRDRGNQRYTGQHENAAAEYDAIRALWRIASLKQNRSDNDEEAQRIGRPKGPER